MKILQKKICLLGDFGVGKTSLVTRFVEGRFSEKYQSTLGVNICRRVIEQESFSLSFVIWDLAGGIAPGTLSNSYLRGAAGAIIVCDLTEASSLGLAIHYSRALRDVSPDASIVLVGNKLDLVEERQISTQTLADTGHSMDAPYLETSAKNDTNVVEAFYQLANEIGGSK